MSSFKDTMAKFRYEVLSKYIKQYQTEVPKVGYVGEHLRQYVAGLPTGSIRQGLMKEFFKQKCSSGDGYIKVTVNKKWCWNTKDKDLQALIKSGFLVMCRGTGWGDRNRYSYVTWSGV